MDDRLTNKSLLEGVVILSKRDKSLSKVTQRYGPPPMWRRKPGFAALVKIILEQQVSLASAEAVYKKLEIKVPEVTAHHIHDLSTSGLRRLGFTRQKSMYCHGIAKLVLSGELNLKKLDRMDNEEAYATLTKIKGIGPWTANIYLLMALRRQDIWPDGDLALAESCRQIKGLATRPDNEQLRNIAKRWKPWRSVAARILWHNYLCGRKN